MLSICSNFKYGVKNGPRLISLIENESHMAPNELALLEITS